MNFNFKYNHNKKAEKNNNHEKNKLKNNLENVQLTRAKEKLK